MKEKYKLGDVWYMDNWPFGPSMIVASDPDITNQFLVHKSMPKSSVIAEFTKPIGGLKNLVADDGARWK